MSNVAFLVDTAFARTHVGVRNYIFSLKFLFEKHGHSVEFVIRDHDAHWYSLSFADSSFEGDNGARTRRIEGSPASMMRQYYSCDAKAGTQSFHRTALGSAFPSNWFDICIITAPWCIRFEERLPCSTVLGLVHDIIPNTYALTHHTHPFAFADAHRIGYEYYIRNCDAIITNSLDTARNFRRYFGEQRAVTPLPPVLPRRFIEAEIPSGERDNSLLLAGPLDLRKGLKYLPSYINALRPGLEGVTMFGGIRCRETDALDFFRALKVDNLVWYPSIGADDLVRLYGRSRLMLFPSLQEGLGIPVIEAQWMGTKVAVRNKSPMRDIADQDSVMLPESPLEGGPALEAEIYVRPLLAELTSDDFDNAKLAASTRARFDPRRVWEILSKFA